MFRPLSVYIGTRYTRAKKRNHYISFISLTSMIGLTLGVLAMIVVLSVMNGFQKEMRSRILGMVPHAVLQSASGVPLDNWAAVAAAASKHSEVVGAVPFTQLDGMLSFKGMMQPIEVDGVDPQQEPKVSIIGSHMLAGSLDALKAGESGVVIGEITARRFHVNVGDSLLLIVPESSATPGGITPRMQRLNVVGVFRVGAELDGTLALIHVDDAARLLRWQSGQVQSVRIAFKDLFQAPEIGAQIATELGAGYRSVDWTHTQGSLFGAMKMEKTMIGLLLLLIVAVAAFNIIATLIMVVADKRTDIAILRTLGMTPGQIMAVFMVQGSVIGVIGTLVGGTLGVIAAFNVTAIVSTLEKLAGTHIFSSDVYFINYLPSDVQALDVLLVCAAALTMSFLATLYPAWRAASTQPAESLRYE
ncbi:lipoprotein-releasing ABC transporter permease subunit [Pseudomonas panipatensis]|uniref:lipoprotein-releasing ABC transporter permease subunit n=1 Tax=Pseudomonas panipatensis TaxID=428992 RepID=UPI0035AF46A8